MKKLFFIVLFLPFLHQHAFTQWEPQTSPTTKNLYDVKFINHQTGWIVGSEVLLRTDDRGNNWSKHDLPGYYLNDSYVFNDTLGWLVGHKNVGSSIHGLRMRTTDGGKSWAVIDSSQAGYFESIYFVDENYGWIAGGQGAWPDTLGLILRTIDGGTTWSRVDSGKVSPIRDIVFLDELTGFAVGEYGDIYKSQDGGLSWQLIAQAVFWDGIFRSSLRQVYFTSPDSGWVVGGIGGTRVIGRTADGGDTWQFDLELASSTLHGLCFVDSKKGWTVGGWGMIFQTSDFGNSWVVQQQIIVNQKSPELESICMVKENEGWIVGTDGLILKFKEGEVTNVESSFEVIPSDFKLFQNYPNPFNASTTISYYLPKSTFVTLKIYNVKGEEIETLISGYQTEGMNKVTWNATDLPGGFYICRLNTEGFTRASKLLLQK